MTLKLERKIKRIWRKSAKRTVLSFKKITSPLIFGSLKKIAVVLLILGLNWSGLVAIGQTAGYFSDNENSSGNEFNAAILDLTVRSGQGNFVPSADNMMPGQQVNRDIYVGKTALSLPLKHNVSFEFVNGNSALCDELDLKIWYDHYHGPKSGGYANRDMRLTYNGKLSVLSDYGNIDFEIPHPDDQFDDNPSDGTEQWFYYSIILPSGIANDFQGEVCDFNFAFNAWQDNLTYLSGGFTDTEKLGSIIKVGYQNPPVVLNEFLPNAVDYPEFVELFNKTASPIDLDGFYIKANDSVIPINAITTHDYSGSSTIIPENGWLVVTTGGNLINNTSGTIALYNSNNVVVDSYGYGTPDHNVNNTPGWTNNLVGYWPFDGDFEDKSGNGNDGTNNGTIFTSGKINEGLSFDGTDDYVEVADPASLDIADQITVEGWIKPNSFVEPSTVAGKWKDINGTNQRSYLLTIAANGTPRFYISTNGANYPVAIGNVLPLGQWYHLVGTYDGTSIKLYVNGTPVATQSQTGNIFQNDEPLLIGANDGWGGTTRKFTNGLIDEVKIYNRVLGVDEVSAHYNDVGSSGSAVPVDKSYARIPDGTGTWVDPMPTPGRPNKLVVTDEENELENVAAIEEQTASPSFSETLGAVAGAVTEFVLGEEEVAASASAGTVVDVPDLAPVASESVEPLPEPETLPETSSEPSATSEPTLAPEPADNPQPSDDSTIQASTEPAVPAEPVTVEPPAEPVPPPADPPTPPAEALAPAPEAPAAPAE